MLPSVIVLTFGGRGSSFFNYDQRVKLWRQGANLDPSRRPSALVLHMDAVARQDCMAAGGDAALDLGGV